MINIERILCPTDLTPDSDEALRYGLALARAYNAHLFLCHCVPPAGADAGEREYIKRLLERSIVRRMRDLGRDPECAPGAANLNWEALVIEGDPVVAITQEAAERRVDLICMRSRRRPYEAALLGSTAESICRTAPCPVLVTHPREREWVNLRSGEIDLRRLLVAHDFSDDSELALSYGLLLAQEYQAELHLIHVLPPRPRQEAPEIAWLPASDEDAFKKAARCLKSSIPAEALMWCEAKVAVREGNPYREILAYAEENEIDLICMGVRGAGFGMRALFGSNVDRVLRQAPCPVLIARPLRPSDIQRQTSYVRRETSDV